MIGIGIGIGFNSGAGRGRVLSNILGTAGSCESLTPFTTTGSAASALSTTQKKSGSNSIKFTTTANSILRYEDYTHPLEASKQYFVGVWVYVESYTDGAAALTIRDVSTFTTRYTANVDTATVGSWQFIYIKIPTSNTLTGTGFRLVFGIGGTGTMVCYYDEIRIYEVSASDYAAIGTTWTASSTPSIDDIFPYRDTP